MSFEWPLVRLSEMVSIKHGFAFKGVHFSDAPTPDILVTPGNFAVGGGFKTDKLKFYDGPIPEEYELRKDDLVVTMTDLSKQADTLGYSALIPEHPSLRFLHNQRVGLVALKSNQLDKLYLYFLLRSQAYRHHVVSSATGSTVKHTSPSKIVSFEFRLPPIETLKEIGSILKQLEDKALLNHQINQTLEQMAQAIFKSWFVDFEPVKAKIAALEAGGSEEDALLAAMQVIAGDTQECAYAAEGGTPGATTGGKLTRLQVEQPEQYAELRAIAELFPSAMQDSELGEIPEGWRSGLLSDICDFQNGHAFKSKDWSDSGFAVVKIGSVKPAFVDIHSCSYVKDRTIAGLERFELFAGDLLVGMTGYPGETGLVPITENRLFLNQRVGRLKPKQKTQKALLYCNARDPDFKQYVETQAHGSAQANISGRAIGQYPITIPTDSVVEQFSTLIDPLLQQKLNLNAASTALATIRDTLLPQLLSGEISVTKTKYQSQLAVEPSDIGDGVAGDE